MRDIAKAPLLDRQQELTLFERAGGGDVAALHTIIESHLKMVLSIARHHKSRLPLADRVEEGNMGMMHAAQKFDPSYGCRFSTYAAWWVRAYIERAVSNQAYIVRIPVYVRQEINVMRHIESALTFQY
ncbi:MAG: sigma-70 family RNA polymerase sigma factor, partial [Mariprofundales bacterium]|nr:sigma-70 family RNA polymerase sigma factor [Mariprofundales bacterium]